MTNVETTIENEAIPYRGEQPYGVPEDLVVPRVLDVDNTDERLWVPQAKDVTFRPLLLSVSQGYFVNILRVRRSGVLSRHRHAGPVHAITLRAAGTTSSTTGGPRRAATRSSRPATSTRWSFPTASRR